MLLQPTQVSFILWNSVYKQLKFHIKISISWFTSIYCTEFHYFDWNTHLCLGSYMAGKKFIHCLAWSICNNLVANIERRLWKCIAIRGGDIHYHKPFFSCFHDIFPHKNVLGCDIQFYPKVTFTSRNVFFFCFNSYKLCKFVNCSLHIFSKFLFPLFIHF